MSATATDFDPRVAHAEIVRVRADGSGTALRDAVAVEEPLEIRVDGEPLAITMRTPGADEELAVGFLAGEGLIGGRDDIVSVGPTDDLAANVVEVATRAGLRRDPSSERRFYLSSSCGVCGKAALEFVEQEAPAAGAAEPMAPEAVLELGDAARSLQDAFDRTGGIHATALVDPPGTIAVLREDVGRHNAMDKAIGSLLLAGRFPIAGAYAWVSGRASFELVQKCSLAGLAGLMAVGPPSSLAVRLAQDRRMLLCGFVRGGSFNIYAGADRLTGAREAISATVRGEPLRACQRLPHQPRALDRS
jgi:FdhD protein